MIRGLVLLDDLVRTVLHFLAREPVEARQLRCHAVFANDQVWPFAVTCRSIYQLSQDEEPVSHGSFVNILPGGGRIVTAVQRGRGETVEPCCLCLRLPAGHWPLPSPRRLLSEAAGSFCETSLQAFLLASMMVETLGCLGKEI